MKAAWVLAGALALGAGIPLGWGELVMLGKEMPVQESGGWAVWLVGIAAVAGLVSAAIMMLNRSRTGVVAAVAGILAAGALVAYALSLGGAAGDAMVPPGSDQDVLLGVALGPGWYVSMIGAVVMTVAAFAGSLRS